MSRTEEQKATLFEVEVPAHQRKAFRKMLQALEEATVVTEFREIEADDAGRTGGKPLGQNEQMRQYHDLID